MQFVKMHGIGNDYVYINGFEQPIDDPASLAVQISDRHFGVGADGLILVLPPDNCGLGPGGNSGPALAPTATESSNGSKAHVRMRIFNADGSEAEMCGNGIRCVCKFAHDRNLVTANPMRVQTVNGVLTLEYTTDASGKVDEVTVDMGEPVLEPERIPVKIGGLPHIVNHSTRSLIEWPANAEQGWEAECSLDQQMTCVSMGNPHAIFFCGHVERVPLEIVGPVVERHLVFPNRTNVHFVTVHRPGEVTMRTWERGSGVTLACGTGASAVCVAGQLTGRADRHVTAHLPGGDLDLCWNEENNHVYMTGPATEVYTGEWDR